jgi:hypothetical protein
MARARTFAYPAKLEKPSVLSESFSWSHLELHSRRWLRFFAIYLCRRQVVDGRRQPVADPAANRGFVTRICGNLKRSAERR